MNKSQNYFKGDDFISKVWESKYAADGENTPDDMHFRMAKEFARIRYKKDKSKSLDEWEKYFFDLFKGFGAAIPQGRVMAGLGVEESYRSLSNCLRLPPPADSYSSIMKVDTMLISAAKRGCGYGIGLSNIRPYGAKTTNSAKTSTGVIPFGERYSNSTKEVGQEGRRGACLLDLDIRHPESPSWATVKLDKTKYTGANISFKIWGDFMEAVKKDEDYILRFPTNLVFEDDPILHDDKLHKVEYDDAKTGEIKYGYIRKVKARELWNSSIHTVWSDGCPGLQFWDRIMDYDPSSVYAKYRIDGTNACGEQPMAIYDTCRLLVIALIRAIKNAFRKDAKLDEDLLYHLCYTLLEVGDDLIDLEIEYIERIINKIKSDPEDEKTKAIELELWTNVLDMAKSGRRIGAGITGLADMLAAINLKYDSDKALDFTDKVMRIKFMAELDASIDLAIKYGPFEGWDPKLEKNGNDWYRMVEREFPSQWEKMQKYGRRFVNWSTIAPVGTTSIVTPVIEYFNISSGGEPQFGLYYFRNKKVDKQEDPYDYVDEVGIRWKQFPVIMGAFKDWLKINIYLPECGVEFDEWVDNLSKTDLEQFYRDSPWYMATANDIDWKKRIQMQSILQKYTTSAISSTINLPKDVKEEVISDIYMYSYEMGLKGITCYRDGSKGNVLSHEAIKKDSFGYTDALKRPKELEADYYNVTLKGVNYGVVVGLLDHNPYEVFAFENTTNDNSNCKGKIIKKKKGNYTFVCDNFTIENLQLSAEHSDERLLTRWISLLLRHGVSPRFIIEQVEKSEVSIVSFGKVITRVLKKYIKDSEIEETCLDCGQKAIIYEEGCKKCKNCGSSKC